MIIILQDTIILYCLFVMSLNSIIIIFYIFIIDRFACTKTAAVL